MPPRALSLALFAACVSAAAAAEAQTPLAAVRISTDVTAVLGGVPFADDVVAEDDLAGAVTPVGPSGVPAAADVVGYHLLSGGRELLAFETAVSLPGAVVAGRGDVVRFDGGSFSLELTGAAAGIPAGAGIDAVGHTGAALLLSLDVTADLGGTIAGDEDVVAFDGAAFTLFFDGSAAGVPAALDLDAVHLLANGNLLISFDGGGVIDGLAFADEDVLEVDPSGPAWVLAYDGSAQHAGWVAADLDALAAAEAAPPGPPGEIRFTAAGFFAVEDGDTATITVERVGGTAGAVGVSFATADGSAAEGLDYLADAGILEWADGEGGARAFDVALLDDDLPEGDETVLLTLAMPTGGAVLGDPSAAVLTLIDDEAGGPSVIEIPTLGELALALLALLLAAAAVGRLRQEGAGSRRSTAP